MKTEMNSRKKAQKTQKTVLLSIRPRLAGKQKHYTNKNNHEIYAGHHATLFPQHKTGKSAQCSFWVFRDFSRLNETPTRRISGVLHQGLVDPGQLSTQSGRRGARLHASKPVISATTQMGIEQRANKEHK